MSIEKTKVTQLLSNYLSYKAAIANYERYKPMPSAGIANYSGMPSGSGAPEAFFDRVGKMGDMGFTTALDVFDYGIYSAVVDVIEFTVAQVLTDDEKYVIQRKWMDRNPMNLCKIAIIKNRDESTIKRWHKNALGKLSRSFSSIQVIPHIETIEKG